MKNLLKSGYEEKLTEVYGKTIAVVLTTPNSTNFTIDNDLTTLVGEIYSRNGLNVVKSEKEAKELYTMVALYHISDLIYTRASKYYFNDELSENIAVESIEEVVKILEPRKIIGNYLYDAQNTIISDFVGYMFRSIGYKINDIVKRSLDKGLSAKGKRIKIRIKEAQNLGYQSIDEIIDYVRETLSEKVTEEEIEYVMAHKSEVSLFDNFGDDDNKTLEDTIPDEKMNVESNYIKRAFVKEVQDAIDNLIDEYAEKNILKPSFKNVITLEQLKNQYRLLLEIKKLEIENENEFNKDAKAINNKKIQEIKKHISKSRNISTTAVDDAKRKLWGYLEKELKSMYEAV